MGIGNTIRGDDGIGIRVARKLKEILSSQVDVKESPTAGLDLIESILGYRRAILIDAIRTPRGVVGQIHRFGIKEIRAASSASFSHGLGLGEIVKLGTMLMPREMPAVRVLGVEAKNVNDFSENLSPELERKFDEIVEVIGNEIRKDR